MIQKVNDLKIPQSKDFEKTVHGKPNKLYELKNKNGMSVWITNYGGRIVGILAPDKNGVFDDVVLGFLSIDEYLEKDDFCYGALIGPFANRISGAKFSLDGKEFQLEKNAGENHLHGGLKGFHKVMWDEDKVDNNTLVLFYRLPHMSTGYPGNISVHVKYELTDNNELAIHYKAVTDQRTILNLTSHPYFNLSGEGNDDITSHILKLSADYYTVVNQDCIPNGEIAKVEGTPLDFGTFRVIGERINDKNDQLEIAGGYDHNFVINRGNATSDQLILAASVYCDKTGRKMEVYTTEPGVQFYTGNNLPGTCQGKKGKANVARSGFCLETQHFPDSPNHGHFPSVVLDPGREFRSTTVYKFGITEE